jgi:hypothetical protein
MALSPPGLAVQRYICVCHAPLAKRLCTVARARWLVAATVAVAALHMLPRALDRSYSVHRASPLQPRLCLVHLAPWVGSITADLYFM